MRAAVQTIRDDVDLRPLVARLDQGHPSEIPGHEAVTILREVGRRLGCLADWFALRAGDVATFHVYMSTHPDAPSAAVEQSASLQRQVNALAASLAALTKLVAPEQLAALLRVQFLSRETLLGQLLGLQHALDQVFETLYQSEEKIAEAMAFADDRRLALIAMQLSQASLKEVWDNPVDAEYDKLV